VAATVQFDFGPFAQILRTLLPRARGIYLYAPDADLTWSSDGAEYFDLRPVVLQLLEESRQPARLAQTGCLCMLDEAPAYCFLLRDELGAVLGVVAVLCRAAAHGTEVPPFEAVERILASLLALTRRELTQQRGKHDTGALALADSKELQWLLDVTHIEPPPASGADALQTLLDAFAERCECDVALLHVPARRLERTNTRYPIAPHDLELLVTLAGRHLQRVAETQQRTLIVNKVREAGVGGLVPFRILCVPLLRRGAVIGIAVAFNRATSRPFDSRDGRMLERLGPRLLEIIDVRFDEATGLLTRHAFEEQAALLLTRDPKHPRCIVYADVDQLHGVNELFGFAAGDEVLRSIADAWRAQPLPNGSVAARVAGDRFVTLLNGCSLAEAQRWAEAARAAIAALAPPARCAGLKLSASFGVVVLEPGVTLEHARAAAETAAKTAKDRGRNRVETFAAADASVVQRHEELRTYRDLASAFEQDRFQLYAQPLVPLWDPSRQERYEILVRLLDDKGQPVAPERFFAAAARFQLLAQLDRWVLGETLARLAACGGWLESTGTTFWLNVSAQSLAQPDFVDHVRRSLDLAHVPPPLLNFEISESAAIGRLDQVEQFIARTAEFGCRASLDDFGTGGTSLAYLQRLHVTTLKIDGVFVRDLLTNPRSESMVRAILHIARQMELETVAECVETREVAMHLATLGVTYGQGFAFAPPRPLAELLDELARKSAPRLTDVARPPAPATRVH